MISEQQWVPYDVVELTGAKALVLAPHPDDETLGCGGSLLLHRKKNDPVKVIVLTDGQKGDFARRCSSTDYISLRAQETRAAADLLGVDDLEFWNIPDRRLADTSEALPRLITLLENYRPDLVYVPSPVEIHPDHRAAAYLAWEAVRQLDFHLRVVFYETNQPLRVNALVDISTVVLEKAAACDAYQSQSAERAYKDTILGLNRFRSLTLAPSVTHAEGFCICSSEEVKTSQPHSFWLKQFAVAPVEHTMIGPPVSVIIRTLNRPCLLREAILSVLAQTYRNFEIIVVNDGGTDVGHEIDGFAALADIRYLTHPESKGRAAAANTGLKTASGKYVNLLDDDDLFYPNHLEVLVNFLERTRTGAAYTDCETGYYIWKTRQYQKERLEPIFGFDFDRGRLLYENFIPSMTMMVERELCRKVGLFDESLAIYEDWDYWIRLARISPITHLPAVTAQYRQFEGRSIGAGGRGYDFTLWTSRVLGKHRRDWPPEAGALADYLRRMIRDIGNGKHRITAAENRGLNRLAEIIADKDLEITCLGEKIAKSEEQLRQVEVGIRKTKADFHERIQRQVTRQIGLAEKYIQSKLENRRLSMELDAFRMSRAHRSASEYVKWRKKLSQCLDEMRSTSGGKR